MNDKTKEFPFDRLAKWGRDILTGVHVLHTHDPQVVHRDLKSLNVLVRKEDEPN